MLRDEVKKFSSMLDLIKDANDGMDKAHGILEDILMYLETMDTGNIRNNIEKAMKILQKI